MTAHPPSANLDSTGPESGFSPIGTAVAWLFRLPRALLLVLAVLALLLPIILARLDGSLAPLMEQGNWRLVLVPPLISLYILILVPVMGRIDTQITTSIRPVLQLDDDAFHALKQQGGRADGVIGLVAFVGGALLGFISLRPWNWAMDGVLINSYLLLTTMLMYALLAWVIVESVLATRVTNTMLSQPLDIDVFDLSPFEPIGRQSLMLTFSFVVGITISILFVSSVENIFNPVSMAIYALLLSVSVLLFFLNMRPTHAVLAAAKRSALDDAGLRINDLYRQLQSLAHVPDARAVQTTSLASELNAWIVMEERLKQARTWPYDTEMLRTLAVTVLTPIAVALSRIAVYFLQNQL